MHTFASDPARGVFILAILVLFIGGGLSLFAWRAPMLKQGGLFAPISREGALVFNNLFLTTACLTVFVGTLYPLALEAFTGEKISVGAPFFNLTFAPLFIPLLFAVPFGPLPVSYTHLDVYKRQVPGRRSRRSQSSRPYCAFFARTALDLDSPRPVAARRQHIGGRSQRGFAWQ